MVFIVIPYKGILLILGLSLREDIVLGQSWDKALKSFPSEQRIRHKAGILVPARTLPSKKHSQPSTSKIAQETIMKY